MAGLLGDISNGATISSYTPTLRERVVAALARNWYGDTRKGYADANRLMDVVDMTPAGLPGYLYDMGREVGMGNAGTAGLMASVMALPMPRTAKDDAVGLLGNAARGAAEKSKGLLGIRAYHGSPHDYPAERLVVLPDNSQQYIVGAPNMLPKVPEGATVLQDFPLGRMRMDKIGTGEGAQAYGHGLYFAEDEAIAKSYRDALKHKGAIDIEGEAYRLGLPLSRNAQIEVRRQAAVEKNDPMKAAFWLQGASAETRDLPQEKLAELIDLYRTSTKGRMYEVDINADPNAFLDWDKPLSEQPEAVRAALKKLNIDTGSMTAKDRVETIEAAMSGDPRLSHLLGKNGVNITGDKVYKGMSDALGATDWPVTADAATRAHYRGKAAAITSDKLREAGIPGVKYLDAGSRGAGDGTRNYVVFDDKLISIVRKYGIAGASLLLGYNVLDGTTPAQAEILKKAEPRRAGSR